MISNILRELFKKKVDGLQGDDYQMKTKRNIQKLPGSCTNSTCPLSFQEETAMIVL